MSTTTLVPMEGYLHTAYRPDCDYVDGKVEERNLGEFDHASLQMAISAWFYDRRKEWNIHVLPEQRVRVSATRVRIPDVCLVSRDLPIEQVITHPPLAVIEILSPEDRVRRYNERLEDYRRMGVKNIWVIDPATQKGFDCITGWRETLHFTAVDSPVLLDLEALFKSMAD